MRTWVAILGFVIGSVGMFCLEVLIVSFIMEAYERNSWSYSQRVANKGAILAFVIAVIAGFVSSEIATRIYSRLPGKLPAGFISTQHKRFMIVGNIAWVGIFCLFWILVKPYGYRMHDDDWITFFELLMLPPLVFTGLYLALLWAKSATPRK